MLDDGGLRATKSGVAKGLAEDGGGRHGRYCHTAHAAHWVVSVPEE